MFCFKSCTIIIVIINIIKIKYIIIAFHAQIIINILLIRIFRFTAHLRSLTSGQDFTQCAFDHWYLNQNDLFDGKSKSYEYTMANEKENDLNKN